MRIVHIVPSFYPAVYFGGPIYSIYGLCNSLVKQQRVTLKVLTTDTDGPTKKVSISEFPWMAPAGYPVFFCKRILLTSVSLELLRYILNLIRWADVVHLTAVYSFPTIPTFLACRILRKPLVWSPRGSLQRWKGTSWPGLKAGWEWLCQLVQPQRLVLHATSNEEARDSLTRFPSPNFAVIPNGVCIPKQFRHNKVYGKLRLLYLGRLHPKKGIENLLEALRYVNGDVKNSWSLRLAGTGDLEYVRSIQGLIDNLGLRQRVEMTGGVVGKEKERLFQDTDVVVMPSFTENFGMVIAEALAHGIPVIAGKGTPWNRLDEMKCGLWVDNSPRSLAQSIERISRMPLREMGERGRKWMEKEFSWDDRAKEMADLYDALC